jgi:3-hydroxyethyl bacteriochlorophyllide a dehydrogenase
METLAVVIEKPGEVALRRLGLAAMGAADLLVEIDWSGISTGTEKLLWSGRMPPFPGLGYPLVPGYEAVGRVVDAGPDARRFLGQTVFVPGASCFEGARGLFGGSARRLVVPAARAVPVEGLGADAALLALAATARHAIGAGPPPELVVGHGVLGRLVARLAVALGGAPTVWEVNPARRAGAAGYAVTSAEADPRSDYATICDASGASGLLDLLIGRLARGGEIVLAGFYEAPLSFAFPPAFMREARLRVAAEFASGDVADVLALVADGRLSLEGLITHTTPAADAPCAYARAFEDSACLKMLIDWRELS